MTGRNDGMQDAAVLVPLYRDDGGELRLVLVRRSEAGVHGGELAFPGGKPVPTDRTILDTALRETREEIGVSARAIEIIEHLPIVETLTSRFRIYPFLARVVAPPTWQREEREIAEILEVRVRDLTSPEAHGEEMRSFAAWPDPKRICFYRVGPHKLWGATYRILSPLLPRIAAPEWPV